VTAAVAQLESELALATDAAAVFEIEQRLFEARAAERAEQNRERLRQEYEALERAEQHEARRAVLVDACADARRALASAIDDVARAEHARAETIAQLHACRDAVRRASYEHAVHTREDERSRESSARSLAFEVDEAARAAADAAARGADLDGCIEAARKRDTHEKRAIDAVWRTYGGHSPQGVR
jgi:hypothetical protein